MSRGDVVTWYRLYFLDKDDHIRRAVNIEALTDKQAVAFAEDQKHPFAVEIWQGVHLLETVKAGDRPG